MSSANSKINATDFRSCLIKWYNQNKRELPWRYTNAKKPDPYKVWLSEIMLQQTVVKAVIPYFNKFTQKWPTVQELAYAKQEDITDAWAGLGYYSRARNLHKCAEQVVLEHNGLFPDNEKELLKLKGIGPYTAAAITSIAYNKPANIIDGNVERVMARVFMLPKPLKESKKEIKDLAEQFIDTHEHNHHDYAQSLMELGALICTPKSPKCKKCPISQYCQSYRNDKQAEIPVKAAKKNKPEKYGYAYIITNEKGEILVERREEKGLLGNMLGLPTSNWLTSDKRIEHLSFYEDKDFTKKASTIKHVFTHFTLYLTVYQTHKHIKPKTDKYYWIKQSKIESKLPSVFEKVYNVKNQGLDGVISD